MSRIDEFAIFILTHGRSDDVITLKTLKRCGYTGPVYLVIDTDDEEAPAYFARYGDKVLQFSKKEIEHDFDVMDNFHNYGVILYARNASQVLAKKLGYKYMLQLDDDYTNFSFRYEQHGKLKSAKIKNIDKVFENMLDFLEDTGALTVAFTQGGDLIGGTNTNWDKRVLRKAMNTFFSRTDIPIPFIGSINEDVNAYCDLGRQGELIMSVVDVQMDQRQTQGSEGGMTGAYLDGGTYLKSFYTVMVQPSSVTVAMMGDSHYRLHHNVDWNATVPKIINQKYKRK